VQDPEVEPARHGGRVGQREVLLDGPALEAAAVDRDAERVEAQGAGAGSREDVHGGRQRDRARDDALGVVVTAHEDRRDAGAVEARHLPGEEQADRGVGPVAVVDVARHHHEGDRPLDRLAHQILEGLPTRRGEATGQIRVARGEPRQRAAEVQVGGMDEAERRHGLRTGSVDGGTRRSAERPAQRRAGS